MCVAALAECLRQVRVHRALFFHTPRYRDQAVYIKALLIFHPVKLTVKFYLQCHLFKVQTVHYSVNPSF